jgi:hypothetical protein
MGKSTLSRTATDRIIIGSDAYRELDWGDIPAAMIRDAGKYDSFVIEGVQVARALRGPRDGSVRKLGLDVDAIIYLRQPKVPLAEMLPGQLAMAKAVRTIFDDWHRTLARPPAIYEEPQVIPGT